MAHTREVKERGDAKTNTGWGNDIEAKFSTVE
jgi:hypothetical protein